MCFGEPAQQSLCAVWWLCEGTKQIKRTERNAEQVKVGGFNGSKGTGQRGVV